MALITSLQNGDWNDTATWVGGVVPVVDVDTVSIGHVVTLQQDEGIGTSPAFGGVSAVVFTAGGQLRFNGYRLTAKGDITTSGQNERQLVMSPGSHLYFDNSGAPNPAVDRYRLTLTAQYPGTIPALYVRGAPGNRATISANPGTIGASISSGFAPYGGLADAEYLSLRNLGSPGVGAWNALIASDGSDALSSLMRLRYVDVVDSYLVQLQIVGAHAKVLVEHVTVKNSLDTNYSFGWSSFVAKAGSESYRIFRNNIFDRLVQLFAPRDVVIEGNQFHDSLETSNIDTSTWATFENNLVVMTAPTENVFVRGNIANNYWLHNDPVQVNPHFLTIGVEDIPVNLSSIGNIFEFTGTNEEGDTQLVSSVPKSTPYTLTFEDNIVIPNAAGGSSGTLVTALGEPNTFLVINNNTGIPGSVQPIVALGETYAGHPNMVSSFRRNLGWDYTVREFLAADALPDDAVVDLLPAAVTQYNGMHNLATGTNGVGFTRFELSSGNLGASTVQADPLFVDRERDISAWDIYAGGTGSIAHALYQLSLANDDADYIPSYTVDSLYNYVREGFTPQQAQFVNVDNVGGFIGAVQPLTAPVYTTTLPACICERIACKSVRLTDQEIQASIARILCAQQEHSDTEIVVLCEPGTNRLVLVTYRFDVLGNLQTVTANYLDGTLYAGAIGDLVECSTVVPEPVELTVETYRLDGNTPGIATPSTGPGSAPIVGNTVTIAAPFNALAWRYMRGTAQDPNDGSVGSLVVNGFTYYPGVGGVYTEVGQSLQSSSQERFVTPYEFTANGDVVVELVVHR